MKRITKTILALMAGAVAVTSCNKELDSPSPFIGNNEIAFGSRGVIVGTRAFTETTNALLQANGFGVAAILDADNSTMFNAAVAYESADGVYRVPGSHYYYPSSGTVSFYGVYPSSQAITLSSGVATLAYSQNADTDLVGVAVRNVARQNAPVQMDFEHLLSQVTVQCKGYDTTVDYKVTSISIKNANGGTYAYADDSWTRSSTLADYSYLSTDTAVASDAMTPVGSPMSFVPGDIDLTVAWKCFNKGTETVISENEETVSTNITKGKHTSINLTLPSNSSEITLVTSVGEWVDEDADISLLPDALFAVKARENETVKLPVTTYAPGTKFKIKWGDGSVSEYGGEESGTKAGGEVISVIPEHTYTQKIQDNVQYYVSKGNITVHALRYDADNMSISNEDKVAMESIRALMFAADGEQTISLKKNGTMSLSVSLQYSYDAVSWTDWDLSEVSFGTEESPIIYIRGINSAMGTSGSRYYSFAFTTEAKVECYGSVMHLINYNKDVEEMTTAYGFYSLFKNCTQLVRAPRITANKLEDDTCWFMFDGCSSLEVAPELWATTIGRNCYSCMFQNCSSLKVAPELPATELAYGCYNSMFKKCISLTSAPELPATHIPSTAYQNMFAECTNLSEVPLFAAREVEEEGCKYMFSKTGTLRISKIQLDTVGKGGLSCMFYESQIEELPTLQVDKAGEGAFSSMCWTCNNLKTVNDITIERLHANCASQMFSWTRGIHTIGNLTFGDFDGDAALEDMFSDNTELTSVGEITIRRNSENFHMCRMFDGCSKIAGPVVLRLPANIVLNVNCFKELFKNCRSLSAVTVISDGVIDNSADGCLYDWLYNAKSTGTLTIKGATFTKSIPTPYGWTITYE